MYKKNPLNSRQIDSGNKKDPQDACSIALKLYYKKNEQKIQIWSLKCIFVYMKSFKNKLRFNTK